jgi:hypothetical protein
MTSAEAERVRDAIVSSGAAEFGEAKAQELMYRARAELTVLPVSPARSAL